LRLARQAFAVTCVALALAACDTTLLLGPDAAQGIDGLVMLGPLCPVATPENPCPDRPYQAFIDILDRDHNVVTSIQSDADGKFRVGLEPGLYIIAPEQGDPFPTATELAVNVGEGTWSSVTVNYDTGIR